MSEVFTRLPADDPRSLVRAAAVCRSWRGILSDPGFARGYRSFHGAPPMLGFLHNAHCAPNRFVPTSTFRRWGSQDRRCCRVLDSRHGLVLLSSPAYDVPFDACDLVTDKWWEIEAAANPKCHDFYNGNGNGIHCNATVLCAIDRCDHLGCHGGPFLVALMGSADKVMNTEHAIGQYSSVFCL